MPGQPECVHTRALRDPLHLPISTGPIDGEKDLIPHEVGTLKHDITKRGAWRADDGGKDSITCLTMSHHDPASMHLVGQSV